MEHSRLTVNGSSNTVVVCAILTGTSDIYNIVRLSPVPDTAGSFEY